MVNLKSLYYQIFRETVLLMHLNEEKRIPAPAVEVAKGPTIKLPEGTKFVNSEAGINRLSEVQRINGLIDRGYQDPRLADQPHYRIPPAKNTIRKVEIFPKGYKKEIFPLK